MNRVKCLDFVATKLCGRMVGSVPGNGACHIESIRVAFEQVSNEATTAQEGRTMVPKLTKNELRDKVKPILVKI